MAMSSMGWQAARPRLGAQAGKAAVQQATVLRPQCAPLSGRSTAACGVPKADIAQGVAKRKPITSAYVRIPPGPPLTLAKGVSRSGYGRIFQLFSRVMRESLFTGLGARRHGSVLSEPIFSGPIACALLVNSLQAAETKASFIWCC